MTETAQQREQIRISILRYTSAAQGNGMSMELLLSYLRSEGVRTNLLAISEEVRYLGDKGFLEAVPKMISPENRLWRITAGGRDWLAEMGID